jgi:4-amino-4-deoxy-L-arabinose transferase-like glycosyltransferase
MVMTKSQIPDSNSIVGHQIRWKWTWFALILALAATLRLYRLDSVPPGLTHDEANNVHDATLILHGVRPFYFPVAQGKEPLYPYSVALVMAIVGPSPFAMRLASALWGLSLVVLSYVWAERAFDRSVALWTAAGLALSFWGVSTSRVGLRAIALPVLFVAAILTSRLTDRQTSGDSGPQHLFAHAVPAGLLLGLTFYTYLAARVMPAIPLLFGLYLFCSARDRWRQCWRSWLVMLIVAAGVAVPLFFYLQAHPSAEIRVGQLDRPLRAFLSGDLAPLLGNVLQALRAFSFQGDEFIPYNLPGRPILDPLMSVLFYAGLVIALRQWRDPAHAFALLWLVVGFFPALATGVEAAHLRAIGAQPVLFVFPALTLESLRSIRISRLRLSWLMGGSALLLVAFLTVRDYFVRWPDDPDVRVHYHVDLMAIADTLRDWEEDKPVVISAFYPMQYHDPRVLEAVLGKDSPPVRWFDGRQALMLPSAPTVGLILPAAIPLDETLWALVEPQVTLLERVNLRPDDFSPTYDVYQWVGRRPLDAFRPAMAIPTRPAWLPVDLGEHLDFQGYHLEGWTGKSGSAFTVLTLWQVKAPLPDDRDAVIFTQLLDSENQIIAQQDRLDAPSWEWQPGDIFLQLHHLRLAAEAPPGSYTLIAGVYTTPDRVDAVLAGHEPDPAMPRLSIYAGDELLDDHLVLSTLEIE